MKATVYDLNTGKILRTVSAGRPQDFNLNIGPDEVWIEGVYPPSDYYIKNQQPCEMPAKPNYPCDFDYASEQWVWEEQTSWDQFRTERNRRLAACDWTQVPDAPVDHQAWAVYRQELRDLPDNTEDPRYPVWPTPPA